MSAAVVTSFFSDYGGGGMMYGKNGGNFAGARAAAGQQVLEPRRHSSSSSAFNGSLHHYHQQHNHVIAPLRRSTSTVTPTSGVLRPQQTSSVSSTTPSAPKPCSRMTVPSAVTSPNASACVVATTLVQTHRKLDRSFSEPVDRRSSLPVAMATSPTSPTASLASNGSLVSPGVAPGAAPAAQNSSRYKTELCRPFEESGTCKYGDKCQFAHGIHELRTLARHPKYKTELCRTFHTTGFCPYGPRCHFIHNSDESRKSLLNNLHHTPNGGPPPVPSRPKALSVGSFGSLGSAGDLSPPSSPLYDDAFGNYTPTSASSSNTAFSFSQDFATLVTSPPPLKVNPLASSAAATPSAIVPGFPTFGGSQPTLTTSPFTAISLPSAESAFQFPPVTATSSANAASVHPLRAAGIVEGPPSPVDSLGSELDTMSVSGGSPAPATCSSPLSRLPIFNRLANARDSD